MDRFIEVVGVGKLVERVAEYRADVTLQVRAAQVETAIKEVAELRNECIRRLRDAGLDEGVSGMRVGGKRQLVLAPQLAYGSRGAGPIPPNATLVFVVELVSVE